MRTLLLLVIVSILMFSCKNKNHVEQKKEKKDSLLLNNKRNINNIGYILTPETNEYVKNWTQYQQFDVYITRYFAISNNDALLNANMLSTLATQMRDSIPAIFSYDLSTITRFNILDSECKRLSDMSSISAIKQEEVSTQIKKILDAYSGINAKLNAVIALQKMEEEINLDPDFAAILNQNPDAEFLEKTENNTKNPTSVRETDISKKKRQAPNLQKPIMKGYESH